MKSINQSCPFNLINQSKLDVIKLTSHLSIAELAKGFFKFFVLTFLMVSLQSASATDPEDRLPPIIYLLLGDIEEQEIIPKKNILLIIADDMGVDNVSIYDEQPINTAQTPTIDDLANNGVMFRNAWANPQCSPTRASVLTGRYAFDHGVTHPGGAYVTLSPDEETFAEVLSAAGYQTALFGKWHLGRGPGFFPTDHGFDYYSGNFNEGIDDYFEWRKSIITAPGVMPNTAVETGYASEVVAQESLAWINQTTGPWLAQVAFNAPHVPFHVPPAGTYTSVTLSGDVGAACTANTVDSRPDCYRAAAESMDFYIGELLANIDPDKLADTLIIFLGDNGTPTLAVVEEAGTPFVSNHAKSTVYEGGVNVPLIISAGSNINIESAKEVAELIQIQDVFSTILEATETTSTEGISIAGQSLLGYVQASVPELPARSSLFTELFNDVLAMPIDRWAATNGVMKVLKNEDDDLECYNLVTDPGETDPTSGDATICAELAENRPMPDIVVGPENDIDMDGIADELDSDIDGDGIGNQFDAFPLDATEWADQDGDMIGDNSDSDLDGDGIENSVDVFPYRSTLSADYVANRLGDANWIININNTLSQIVDQTAEVNVQSVDPNAGNNAAGNPAVRMMATGIPDYEYLLTEELLGFLNIANPLGRSNSQPVWLMNPTSGVAESTAAAGDLISFGQDINYNSRLDTATVPGCSAGEGFGYWPPGPGCPLSSDPLVTPPVDNLHDGLFPKTPIVADDTGCFQGAGKVGFLINGIAIYGYTDALSYNSNANNIGPNGQDVWISNAPFWEFYDVDACAGHAAARGQEYHHHGWSQCLADLSGDTGAAHSPIIGFMGDGYAVHGPWHDQGVLAKSAWVARDYNQSWDPANGAFGCDGAGMRNCTIDDPYNPLSSSISMQTGANIGPAIMSTVSSTSSNIFDAISGAFLEDFYVDPVLVALGQSSAPGPQLDENNGHTHGDYGYHYHSTITFTDTALGYDFVFPYMGGPQYKGEISTGPTGDGVTNQCRAGLL